MTLKKNNTGLKELLLKCLSDPRIGCRSGYRPRRLDTRMGTMYLMFV